jgi:hypothetical protein
MPTSWYTLPSGCISIDDFAHHYGIRPATLQSHILIGLGKGQVKERLAAELQTIPTKRGWEQHYYLTPEQQDQALNFWRRHGIAFIGVLPMPHQAEEKPSSRK